MLSVVGHEDDLDGAESVRQAEPILVVMDFLDAPDMKIELKDADFVCAFHYPILGPLTVPLTMLIRSDPAPLWQPHAGLKVPFYTAKQESLFVITFRAKTQDTRTLVLFVPLRTIMSHVHSIPPGEIGRRFRWSEWGPQGTRLMPAPTGHSSPWVSYVFGSTFISPKRDKGALKAVRMLDFNQRALRRSVDGVAAGSAEIVDRGTTIKGEVFQHRVTTWLPFRERNFDLPAAEAGSNFDAVMLSEDSLLMVSSVSFPHLHARVE